MTASVRVAVTDHDIQRCFPVMRQLRPHLVESEFVARVRLQADGGYELAFLEHGERVLAAAGYRVLENLSAGRVQRVDAHRFYLANGMVTYAHHFRMAL